MKTSIPSLVFTKLCAHMGSTGIRIWHQHAYTRERGHKADFDHPKDIVELMLSSMQKDTFLQYAEYADKVLVRNYIKEKGLKNTLLDVYGVWNDPKQIELVKLPEKFALKANNGSGGHVFCRDKVSFDMNSAIKQLKNAMSISEDIYHFEPHYLVIEPKVYAEELIDTGSERMPTDYKFTCVKGVIEDVFVCCERESEHTKYCTLDLDWNILPYTKKEYMPSAMPEKPKLLIEMVEIAEILSADFEIVRVDLYEYKDKVYFGELTFSPWGGFLHSYTNEAIELYGKNYYSRKK